MVFLTRFMKKHCYSVKSANFYLLLAKHMYRKHDSLVSKPNHECNLYDYTFSIKEVFAMHMYQEHNGATLVQKSCNMCLFTSYPSRVLRHHLDKKHLGILKMFECKKCLFWQRANVCLSIMNIISTKNTLKCELCNYMTSIAQYLKVICKLSVKQFFHEIDVDSDSLV